MVELKDGQQEELDGRLQFHSCLTLMAQVLIPRVVASLKVHSLKVHI